MLIKAFVSQLAIKAFNVGVLDRLARVGMAATGWDSLFTVEKMSFNTSGIKLAGAVLGAVGALKPEWAGACSVFSGMIQIVDHKQKVRKALEDYYQALMNSKEVARLQRDAGIDKLGTGYGGYQNTYSTNNSNVETEGKLFYKELNFDLPVFAGFTIQRTADPDLELEKDFRMHLGAVSTGLVSEDNDVKGPTGNTQLGGLAVTASAFYVYINGSLNVKLYDKRLHVQLNLNMDPYATNPTIDPFMSAIVFFEVWDSNGIVALDVLDAMKGYSLIGHDSKGLGTFDCKVGDLVFGVPWAVDNKVFEYELDLIGKPVISTHAHVITVNASLNFNFGASEAALWPKGKTILLQTISFEEP